MGGMQPDSTEIKSGLLPRFPGRRACEVNLRLSCFVVWLVVVRTGVWTAQAIGHLHVWIMIRVRGNAGYSSLCKRFVSLGRVSTHQNERRPFEPLRPQMRCGSCNKGHGSYYHRRCFFKVHRCSVKP